MTVSLNTMMNDAFRGEGKTLLDQIKTSVYEQNSLLVAKNAHDLGGAARRIGATNLQERCEAIEVAARATDIPTTKVLLQGIDILFLEALSEANKTSIDRRLEGLERSVGEFQLSMKSVMEDMRTTMIDAVTASHDAIVQQTEATRNLTMTIQTTFKDLIDSLTGKGQVSQAVMDSVTKSYNDMMKRQSWLFMGITGGLVFVVVFVFTGQKWGWFPIPK